MPARCNCGCSVADFSPRTRQFLKTRQRLFSPLQSYLAVFQRPVRCTNKLSAKENSYECPVVLITGALTGIGRATALAFAQEGARIAISGRRDEAGQELAVELRMIGVEAEYWRADVRQEGDLRSLIDKTVAHFGRLDVAVNNAGT